MECGPVRPSPGCLLFDILLRRPGNLRLEYGTPQGGEAALTGMFADLHPGPQRRENFGFRQCGGAAPQARPAPRPPRGGSGEPTARTWVVGVAVGAHPRCG